MSDRPDIPVMPGAEPRASADEVIATVMASLAPLSEELRLRLAQELVEGARSSASLPRLDDLFAAAAQAMRRLVHRRFLH